jgi:hypothetical protein
MVQQLSYRLEVQQQLSLMLQQRVLMVPLKQLPMVVKQKQRLEQQPLVVLKHQPLLLLIMALMC